MRQLATVLIIGAFVASFWRAQPLNAQNSAPAMIENPQKTWIFLVGVLEWRKGAGLKSFSVKNRRDEQLRDWLLKAGVPADHIVYLRDSAATLKAIRSNLDAMMSKTQPGDTFFSYYCGHGWVTDGKAYYGNYDCSDDPSTYWSVKSYARTVAEKFKGSKAIFTADCCHSGALGEELTKANPPFSFGVVTSAMSAISSTGNWTFTQSILDCLNGHRYADTNNDGIVTFDEMCRYVNAEMSALERQKAFATRSTNFPADTVVAKVAFPKEALPERAEVKWEEKWYPAKILERKDGQSKVRWVTIGWDTAASDEWVDDSRVRMGAVANENLPVSTSAKWSPGAKVKVKWGDDWYAAVVKKYSNGEYFVHYDGYEASDDEWVAPSAIK